MTQVFLFIAVKGLWSSVLSWRTWRHALPSAVLLVSLLLSPSVLADETVHISMAAPGELVRVTGIVVTSSNTSKLSLDAKAEAKDGGIFLITISVPDEIAARDGLLSANLVTSSGSYYSPVTRIQNLLLVKPAQCLPSPSLNPTLSQVGYVKALIETRKRQRQLSKDKIISLLSDDVIAKITVLEEATGLYPGSRISPEDHPLDLIERLSRLVSVVERSTK